MSYPRRILALAVVAMFLTSGLIAIAGDEDIAVADSTNAAGFSVRLVDGDTDPTYSGVGALNEAIGNYKEGNVIEVLSSGNANGLFIGTNSDGSHYIGDSSVLIDSGVETIVIDFKCEVMTVTTAVGSSGTETQAVHLEKDINIVLKNGEIKASGDNFAILVQNYSNLTLDNMVLDGSGMTRGVLKGYSMYVLSNNYGNIKICGATRLLAPADGTSVNYALDVYHYLPYYETAPIVTFEDDFNGYIKGNVSLYGAVTLNVDGKGTFYGKLEKTTDPVPNMNINTGLFLNDGSWKEAGLVDYYVGISEDVSFVGYGVHVAEYKMSEESTNSFPSLYSAIVLQTTDGTTPIRMIANDSGAGLFITNPVTIDFGGFTYDVTAMTVGSTGTETQAFHIEVPSGKVILQNGTITSTGYSKMLIQNYSELTVKQMTLDGSKLVQGHKASDETQYVDVYTMSNNNANVVLEDSKIIVKEGELKSGKTAFAFDICASRSDCTVTVIGDVECNGSVESSGSYNQLLVLDGVLSITDGSIGSASTHIPVTLNTDGGIKADEGCALNVSISASTSNSPDANITNVVAGENKIVIEHGSVVITGDIETTDKGVIEVLTNNVEMAGDVGENVTVSIPDDTKVTLVGDLNFENGSNLIQVDMDSFIASESVETADVVMEAGSTLKTGTISKTTIQEKQVVQFNDAGDTPTTMIRATFVIDDEHIQSLTYDDKPYYEDVWSAQGITLKLSDIDAIVDHGYRVTGWIIDGVTYGVNDSVDITANCDVTAVVGEVPSYDGSSERAFAIAIVAIFGLGALVVAYIGLKY